MICYLDMDGVLCDFVGGLCKKLNITNPYYNIDNLGEYSIHKVLGMTRKEVSDLLNYDFWCNLEPLPWAKTLVNFCDSMYTTVLLTSPADNNECLAGKVFWINKNFPQFNNRWIIAKNKEFCGSKHRILIDDKESNIDGFKRHGGKTVLFPQPWNRLYDVSKQLDYVVEEVLKIDRLYHNNYKVYE